MRPNLLKTKLASGGAGLGVIAPNRDPILVEVLGGLGFDFYMVDGEHGAISAVHAEELVRACEVSGITPLARVRSNDPKLILQFLDAGVMGIMMPGMQTAADVAALVSATKYPPMGSRGLGPVRAAGYLLKMTQAEYVVQANQHTLVLPQIEDISAIDHLPEMVKVPGVDGFILGPRDLAMSMGFTDGPKHAEVDAAIERVFDVVRGAGLVVGTVAGTGPQARALIDRGAQLILNSVTGLLSAAAGPFLRDARSTGA